MTLVAPRRSCPTRVTPTAPPRAGRPPPPRSRTAALAAAAVVAALTVTACSTEQLGAPELAPAAPSLAKGGNSDKAKYNRPAKSAKPVETRTFVYDPAKRTVQPFGNGDQVTIPAGAVCDPATSGYGVGLWDKPCTALKKPITFTLAWTEDVYGHTIVEFSPDVRFVPGSQVVLEINDKVKPKDREKGTILWCPTGSAACFDESIGDPSMKTNAKGANFQLVRLLKHFSGYNVVFGFDGGDGSEERL